MRRLLNLLYTASGWVAAVFLVAIFAIILVQIGLDLTNRIVLQLFGSAISLMIPSYAEFASYLMAAAMFLGFATALNHGTHVRVTLALRSMSPAVRRIVEFAATAIASGAVAFFAFRATIMLHESWLYEDMSYGLIVIPMWIPQAPMAIGLIVLTIAFLDRLAGVVTGHLAADEDDTSPSPLDEPAGD